MFELDPAVKAMFPDDLSEQGRKLMHAIGLLVRSLKDVEKVQPVLVSLGQRHAGYGVEPYHYCIVGEALIWTLATGLGDKFDGQTKDAWVALYALVSSIMCEAGEATRLAKSA